ncbi:MAG TPA: DUF2911 domain-containing protein [Gemmatimonadales bacterium]|jgi:hypothetical protein
MYFLPLLAFAGIATGAGTRPRLDAVHPDTTCPHRNVPIESRKSPLDSLTFILGDQPVKVCYGRPSSRGRVMLGGASIPYGKLWRTGANEPTIFFAPVPLTVAGLRVQPGVYSLYTVPGPSEWEIIVNRSTAQWGKEDQYTDKIKAQELGRARVKSETVNQPLETFTIRAEPAGDKAARLVLEWEKARVRIPIQASK